MSKDTVELLKECNSGIKMGVDSIDSVLFHVESRKLMQILSDSKEEHEKLENETYLMLNEYGESAKDPNPIAKGMAEIKTSFKLKFDESDDTVIELISDGCNMGVESLRKYLNKYESADEKAKKLVNRLILIEESLADNIGKLAKEPAL